MPKVQIEEKLFIDTMVLLLRLDLRHKLGMMQLDEDTRVIVEELSQLYDEKLNKICNHKNYMKNKK